MKRFELENYIPRMLFECVAAHSDYCGSMNVKGSYREDRHLGVTQESICKHA